MKSIRKTQKGFTIIEVLIVLAIAALILLIVFLAVPALQRNSRNNARKGDVGRIGSAVSEVLGNNNGDLQSIDATPGAAGGPATPVTNAAGQLSQYEAADITVADGVQGGLTPAQLRNMRIVRGAVCVAGGAGNTTNVGAGARQIVVQYMVETSNAAAPDAVCQGI